ncbi:hypothetical protein BWI92_18165 [Flectobacillus sp. BAB-3569]|nr:hypothetical protein BWI92_18165 [Flectobacillus sp. BAB-3569]
MSTYNLEQEEKQNRQFAFIVTSAINILLFIMLWYVTVWNAEENKKVEKLGVADLSSILEQTKMVVVLFIPKTMGIRQKTNTIQNLLKSSLYLRKSRLRL